MKVDRIIKKEREREREREKIKERNRKKRWGKNRNGAPIAPQTTQFQ